MRYLATCSAVEKHDKAEITTFIPLAASADAPGIGDADITIICKNPDAFDKYREGRQYVIDISAGD